MVSMIFAIGCTIKIKIFYHVLSYKKYYWFYIDLSKILYTIRQFFIRVRSGVLLSKPSHCHIRWANNRKLMSLTKAKIWLERGKCIISVSYAECSTYIFVYTPCQELDFFKVELSKLLPFSTVRYSQRQQSWETPRTVLYRQYSDNFRK